MSDRPNGTVLAAIAQLTAAREYAARISVSPWQFAVELEQLTRLGATVSDLRWLVVNGYLQSAREMTRADDTQRRFRPARNTAFPQSTCFIVTDRGVLLEASQPVLPPIVPFAGRATIVEPAGDGVPSWDPQRRVLCYGGCVVKRFRVPSPSQEALLSAIQEEGWPPLVEDPLPPVTGLCSKDRLHDAIKRLNGHQVNRLLHFRGDGTGTRVAWEPIGVAAEQPAAVKLPWRKAA